MTKTNKSLLCALLATVLVLTCALALLPVALPTSANAATNTITYLTNPSAENKSNPAVTGDFTAIDSTNTDNTLKLVLGSKVFLGGEDGLKLGSSNGAGDFSFVVPQNAISISFKIKAFNAKEVGSFNIGSTTYTITSEFADYVYPKSGSLKVGETITLKSTKRAYVKSISITYEESSSNPVTVTINGAVQEGNVVDNDQYKLSVEGAGDKGLVVGGQYKATLQLKSADLTATLKANGTEIESGTIYDIGEATTLAFTVEVQQNTCEHTHKTFVPASEPTCQTKGNETAYYHCDDCGHNFADEAMTVPFTPVELPLADHNLVVDAENSSAATCITDGNEVKKCTTEGCTYVEETVIPALGHDFDENDICTRCGVKKPYSVTIEPSDFTETGGYKPNNGEKIINNISVTVYQVMKQGTNIQFQKNAGYLILNNVSLKSIKITPSTNYITVSIFDSAENAEKNNGGTTVSAVDGVYALNVTNKYIRIAAGSDTVKLSSIEVVYPEHDHQYKDVYDETYHWQACEVCNLSTEKAEHDWTEESTIDSTCTVEGEKVSNCDCGATKTETIAPKGHDWGEWVAIEGNQHQRTCKRDPAHTETADCELVYDGDESGHWQKCETCHRKTDTEEHVWDDGTVRREATCTTEGVKGFSCTVCHKGTKSEAIPALGHNYSQTSRTDSTCSTKGSLVETCDKCGDVKTTTLELAPDKHEHIVVDMAVAATCTAEGKTEGTHCEACHTVVKAQNVIPVDPNVHEWDVPRHVDGTETHRYVCKHNAEHTRDEDCTYDGGVCTKCSAAKPTVAEKQFVVTETIEAGDGTIVKDGKLYVKAGSRIVVKYTITANSGVSALEATLKANANFNFVSMTAGTLDNADITVTGTDVASDVKKAVVTAKAGGFAQVDVVLLTVVYELTDGATIDENMAFGMDLQVCYQGNVVSADGVEVVGNDAKFAERSADLPTITVNGKTTAEELHFTYNGQNVTADKFVVGGRSDVPTVTWTEVSNAGTYTLVLTFADNGTYGEQTATFTVVVDKVVLAAGDFGIALKDGVNLVKKLSGGKVAWTLDDFVLSYNGAAIVSGDGVADVGALATADSLQLTEAGSKDVTIALAVAADGNYTVDGAVEAVFTLTAEKTTLTFDGIADIDGKSKYYDGAEVNVGAPVVKADGVVVDGIAINVTVTKDGISADGIVNAGVYTVKFATALTDEQKKDYEDIVLTLSYTVNKLTVGKIAFSYDGNIVSWQAVKCYADNADNLVDLVSASDVRYTVDGTETAALKIVADGTKQNYTVTLVATDNYIVPEGNRTATTKDVRTVKFVDEKHAEVSKYVFDGQKVVATVPESVAKWTFDGWFVGADKYDFDLVVTANITLTARWTAEVTLTVKYVYNGAVKAKQATVTTSGNTLVAEVAGLDGTKIAVSWLKLVGYYTDEACTTVATTIANANDVTIYAKYALAIGNGDIDGDGNVTNNDIILYRKLIVGGYKILSVATGDEFDSALTTLDEGYVRFFLAVADIDNSGEGATPDIRDIATLRMALVEQDGYRVDNGEVVAPTSDEGNVDAKAVDTSVENIVYALLPVTVYDGKAA